MANKTSRFVTVLMVMLLVLGLALAACKAPAETVTPPAPPAQPATPPAATPPAAPPVAGATSYPAKTYTNSQYGFSIQYPKDWAERPEIAVGSIVAAFGVSGFVPGVSISVLDADAPLTTEWIAKANEAEGNKNNKITSGPTETTLADGTKASQYKGTFTTSTGYDIMSFAVSIDKNGKRIRSTVWTIDAFSPYDEALFSEIAHTLSVK
jgi:hypothetical protein